MPSILVTWQLLYGKQKRFKDLSLVSMIVDTLVTSHLMAVCSKILLQKRATLGRFADVDCWVLQPVTSSMMSELNEIVVDQEVQ